MIPTNPLPTLDMALVSVILTVAQMTAKPGIVASSCMAEYGFVFGSEDLHIPILWVLLYSVLAVGSKVPSSL